MFRQSDESLKRNENVFERDDFTGVVTYDDEVKTKSGQKRLLKFGDVYQDGKRVENVYDYGRDKGNAILAQLQFDSKEQQVLYRDAEGDQDKIEKALRSKAGELTANATAARQQQEFIDEREQIESDWGAAAPIAIALGGAGAGAVAGAGVGGAIGLAGGAAALPGAIIGGIGGALVGGAGALLNQDELVDRFAEAETKRRAAEELNNPLLTAATAIGEYAGAAGAVAQPLSNLTAGAFELFSTSEDGQFGGNIGDRESSREEAFARDNLALEGLRFGAAFADAFAQFASGPGSLLYTVPMAGQVAGGVGTLATGQQWDDRLREFNPIADSGSSFTDAGRWASAIGAVGIDAIQTFTPIGVLRAAERVGGVGSRLTLPGVAGAERRIVAAADSGHKGAQTVARLMGIDTAAAKTIGGRTFIMDGTKAVAVSRVPNVTLLAPSEAVGWMSTRAKAVLSGTRGKAVTAEDLYSAALQIRDLPPVKRALLTGFGEGTEEVVQSFLENWAGGYQPSFDELARAAASGFVVGAGMSAGASVGRDPVMQGYKDVNFARAMMLEDPYTPAQWRGMSAVDRERARTVQPTIAAVARQAREDMVEDQTDVNFNSFVLRQKMEDQTLKVLDAQMQRALPARERTWKLSGTGNPDVPSDVVRMELQGMLQVLRTHAKAFAETDRVKSANALTSLLDQSEVLLRRVLLDPSLAATDTLQVEAPLANGQVAPVGANTIQVVNQLLRDAFEGRGILAENASWTNEEARAALELVFQRSPSDANSSWMMLRPEIDVENTMLTTAGEPLKTYWVSHAILKGLSGDFDGDGISLRSFLRLEDDGQDQGMARERLRLGLNLQTEDSIVIDSYDGERSFGRSIMQHPEADNPDGFIQKTLGAAVKQIADLLGASYEEIKQNLLDPLLLGHQDAPKQLFWEWLATTELVETAAYNTGERVLFRINDIWLQSIWKVGTTISIEEGAKPPASWEGVAENVPSAPPSSDARQRRDAPAATLGQTAERITPGNDNLRVKQRFNYSPQASQTMDSDTSNQLLAWAQKLYRILSSGTTRSQADLATRVDEPARYARQSLQRLLDDFNLERAQAGERSMSIADFARVQVTDVDFAAALGGNVQINGEPISFVQLALRDAVARYRAMDFEVLDANDRELGRKYALLDNMGMKDAAFEVFKEGFPVPGDRLGGLMEDLVGTQIAATMGWTQMSLGQATAKYASLGKKGRKELLRTAKTVLRSQYGAETASTELPMHPDSIGEVTAFRTFMDIIETEGNLFVTLGEDGLASTNTRLGKQDSDSITALEESAKAARDLFLEEAQAFLNVRRGRLTVEQVERLFDLDQNLGNKIIEVIPQELVLTVFSIDADGHAHAPRWFYEFLVEENSELAAFKLWRGLLLAQMNNEAKDRRREVSQDRLVALYQLLGDIDQTGRQAARFEQALQSSTSIRDFLKFVNLNLNNDNAPQMAIIRDQVTFDLNYSKGGWMRSGSQSTLRQNIQAMREQLTVSAKNLNATIRNGLKDEEFLYKLELNDPTAIEQAEKAIARARNFPTGTGPRVLLNSMLSMAIGLVGNESEKAKTARGTEGIGQVTQMQQAAWGTPLNQLLDAWTSISEMDALARPDLLLEPKTFWLQNGTPVEWPGLTVPLLKELAKDRAMRPLLLSILAPTTFDQSVEEGQSTLQSLVPMSFHDIIADPQSFKRILGSDKFQDLMRFGSMIDAKIGENEVLFLVAKIYAARTSGAAKPLNEQDYLQWTEDAFTSALKLLRTLGQVPKSRRGAVKKLLEDMRPNAVLQDPEDSSLTPVEKAEMIALTASIELALAEETKGLKGTDLAAVEARNALLMDRLRATNTSQVLISQFSVPKDPTLQHDAKLRIWQEAQDRGTWWSKIQGNDGNIARDFLGESPTKRGYADGTDEQWEALSRALIVYKLGGGSGQVTATPEARATMAIDDADFRMFMGDWSFLTDFANPVNGDFSLWNTAIEVVQDLKGETISGTEEQKFVDLVRTELFENQNYPLGLWNTTSILPILYAKNRAIQSPAEPAIGMHGTLPALDATFATATRYRADNPEGKAPTRTWSFSSDILRSKDAKGDPLPLTIEDTYEAREFGEGQFGHLGMLQGRFVKSLTVTLADGSPVEFNSVPPSRNFRGVPGTDEAVSGLRVTSPSQIATALRDVGLQDTPVQVSVEFYHPFDRPTEPGWENNVFFDGVPSGSGADAGISLVSSDQQNNGQTQAGSRRALDALKKAKAALVNPVLPSRTQVRQAENPAFMAATIEYKMEQIMKSDRDVSLVGPSAENRIRKQLLVQTLVRGIDEQGVVRTFSAGDLIAHQAKGGDPFPIPLVNAQVVTIPRDFLLTLLGEQGDKGVRFNLDPNAFSLTLRTWDNWKGRFTDEELFAVMPGLFDPASFEFSVETIKKSLFAKTAFLKVSRPARLTSTRELKKYLAIVDRWSEAQQRGGIDRRVTDSTVSDRLEQLSKENIQTMQDWEQTGDRAPAVPARRAMLPTTPGLSSDTQTRMQRRIDNLLDQMAMETTLSIGSTGATWLMDLEGKEGPAFGKLKSLADIDWNAEYHHQSIGLNPIPGDFVLVDPGQPGFTLTIVETLLEGGYKVRLTGRSTSRRAIAEATEELLDTGRFAPRNGAWELLDPRTGSQTALSRESALLSIRKRKTTRFVGAWADDKLEGENASFIVDPELLQNREVGIMKTLVQSNAFGDFQRPGTPASVAAVRKYLSNFADPVAQERWVQHLARLSGTTAAKIRPFIERAIQYTDQSTGLWKTIETEGIAAPKLTIGDFIFLVDQYGQVIITRHGHKPFKTDDNGETLLGQLGDGGVAIYTDEFDDAPTFYEGQVAYWDLAETGLVAEMRVPLSALADKMVFTDDAIKLFGNSLKNAGFDITRLQVNDKIPLSYLYSLATHVKQEATAIDTPSMAIEYLGFDATEAYAKVFLGVNKTDWDQAVQDFRFNGKPEVYQDYRAQIRAILSGFKDAWRNETLRGLDAERFVSLLSGNLPELSADMLRLVDQLPRDVQDQVLEDVDSGVSPELQVTLAALAYLGTGSSQVDAILSTSGTVTGETTSMPEVFTSLFVEAPQGSRLRKWFFERINDQLPWRNTPNGPEGYRIREQDFKWEMYTPGEAKRVGLFSFKEAHSTGSDNGAIFAQSFEHSATQGASLALRNMSVLALYGADAGHSPQLENFKNYLEGRAFDPGTVEGIGEIFKSVRTRYIPPPNKSTLPTPAEILHEKIGTYNVDAFSVPFDMEGEERGWTKARQQEVELRAKRLFASVGLPESEWKVIHGWVRRYLWRPKEVDATPDMAEYGHVSYDAFEAAFLAIENNLRDGRYPTWLADVPIMSADEVSMFIQAYENTGNFIPDPLPWGRKRQSVVDTALRGKHSAEAFEPREKDFNPRTLKGQALREYFYEAALGEALSSSFSSINQNAVDGFLQTYKAVFDNGGSLPTSTDPLVRLQLLDPDFNNIVLSLDKNYRQYLKVVPLKDVVDMRVENVFGGTLLDGKYARSYLGKDEIAKAEARQTKWRKERGIADSYMEGQQVNARGHMLRTNEATTNAAMRVLMNVRLANGMFHPWLFLTAPMETAVRNTFESAVNILTGESFTGLGQLHRRLDDRMRASNFGQSAIVRALSPEVQPTLTAEVLVQAQDTVTSLSHNPAAVSMIHQDLYEGRHDARAGRIERFTERMVRIFGKWQDPSYGITPKSSAQRIVGAVIRYFDEVGTENNRGVSEALALLSRSPAQFRKEHGVAYTLALNSLANARTVKSTSFSLFTRSIIDPLSNHVNPLINIPSNLMLKIPFAFQNYAFNVATNMLGMQGLDAMLALALQGRQSGKAWGRTQAWLSGQSQSYDPRVHGTDYLGNVLESVNFADAFIRAGMTHTALMGLGLVLGGLAGGDEEEKKRRRREEMLGVGHVYDPRDFQNDWRNADAVYLDGIPFLEQLFQVTSEDGTTRAPTELHWTLKQFISPIVGISKFINTGNFNHIVWGFGDGLGSMPLVNAMSWNDAVVTAETLWQKSMDAEAAAENGADETLLAFATQGLLDGVARLERMLFENAFINSVYTAADKYDRDPWTLPDVDADGIIQRDNLGQPMETTAMNEYLDENGNFALGTVGREDLFGQLRSYTERRGTLAFFLSMFSGLGDSDFLRGNMAVREYNVEKQAADPDQVENWILSEWAGNSEVLTNDGAEAFIKSIHAGYIKEDSAVLDNIYLTFDQRKALSDRFESQVRQEAFDLGLTEEEADKRWSDIWWGTDDNPWATPLFDVVWSKGTHLDQIPYDPTSTYRQLNTTWVLGPDGKPWATGIARGELYNFFGQAPLNAYSGAGKGDPIGNLEVDQRLNATDEVGNINTGMRSLEKVNRTTSNPTDEDIMEALKEISAEIREGIRGASYNRDGGGYARYFGGGGSGGGFSSGGKSVFMPFLNDMKQPYIDSVPSVYGGEPRVFRSNVRRQRFSTERGRLNQWQ